MPAGMTAGTQRYNTWQRETEACPLNNRPYPPAQRSNAAGSVSFVT